MSFGGFNPNECGAPDPALRLAGHLSQDQAQRDARNLSQPQRGGAAELVHEYLEETSRYNFQTFRTDELLREVQQVEASFERSPSANVTGPDVTQSRDWFFNQLPPPMPSPAVSQQLLPRSSLLYSSHSQTHFSQHENIPPLIHRPMLLPRVISVPPQSDFRPVQATLEDLKGPWDQSDVTDLASGFFENNEPKTSTDNPEGLKGDREREMGTSSDLAQEVDLESLQISEKADEEGMEASGVNSAQKVIKSKYVERLKKSETESSEVIEDVQTEMEEHDELSVLNEETSKVLSEIEEEVKQNSGETLGPDFWKKVTEVLSDMYDVMVSKESVQAKNAFNSDSGGQAYDFEEENPMLEVDDPFQEGLKRYEVGDFPSAVLCFEAAVQLHHDNAKAWQYLGTSQAANEQDSLAIIALKECLKLEPNNLTALMALAVSYTNENLGNRAVVMLWHWLYHNPKYSDLVVNPPTENIEKFASFLNLDTHKQVQDMFIKAANRHPTVNMDPEVQCALGVLFNLIGDCSKASDCFKAALSVNPEDARIWNRLGATLANGQRSAEAVEAYYRSLSLNPGYVRARYNLGVSCVNLGAHKEAMGHLLKALNQQAHTKTSKGSSGQMSQTIWTTTKVVLTYLGRQDLLPAVDERDLKLLNEEFDVKSETEEA